MVSLGIFSIPASEEAWATVLTYDDIGNPGGISAPGFVELGYQFSSNMVVIGLGPSTLWPYSGTLSGCCAALNDYGGDAIITKLGGGTFSFIDTYMNGWNTEVVNGTIKGYLHHKQVGSVQFDILGPDAGGGRPWANWSLIEANFRRVDEVVISGSGNAFLLDNTQIDSAVPEASTWLMLLLGFAGIGSSAYLRKNKIPL